MVLKTPNKAKSKSTYMAKKLKQWHIKTYSKLSICWKFLNALLLELFNYQFIRKLIFKPPFVQMGSHNQWSIPQQKFENQRKKYQMIKTTQFQYVYRTLIWDGTELNTSWCGSMRWIRPRYKVKFIDQIIWFELLSWWNK